MNKILLFAITLLLPIGLNAQTNYLQDKVAEYYTGSIEQKIKMDSIYQPFADMYKKKTNQIHSKYSIWHFSRKS